VTIAFGLAVYFVVWWVVLFAVLPIGLRTQHEAGEVVPGTPASAPVRPRFLMIIVTTTLVSAAIVAAVLAAFTYGLIDLRPTLPQPGQS
jgi:predicted secreted protein